MPTGGTDIATEIADIRARAASDRRVFADADVKAACARRWRSLFLDEAVEDPVALAQASRRGDDRSARRRIAEYFLIDADREAWKDEQHPASTPSIRHTTLVACPGLLNGLLPMMRLFREELPRVERRFSMRVVRSDSHPVRGCEANAADVLAAVRDGKGRDAAWRVIPDVSARPPENVLLLGYSKGAPDILTTLVRHPEIASRVRAIFTMAGAFGGSEVADKIAAGGRRSSLQQGTLDRARSLRDWLPRGMTLGRQLRDFDTEGAVRDLTTEAREAFLAEHRARIDALNIPMFYVRGATRLSEVPWSQRGGFRLLSGFDPLNDMQVTARRAVLPFPMAVDLGMLRAHHWDLAYPSFIKGRWLGWNNTYHPFPKDALLAATIGLMGELGLID